MRRFGLTPRSYTGIGNMNALHLLLVLLYWQGVNTGQSSVIVEHLAILKPQNIELLCILTDFPNKPQNITGYWTKNGNVIENSEETINRHDEQYFLRKSFNIHRSNLGNYSCIFRNMENKEEATFVLKAPAFKDKQNKRILTYIGYSVALDCGIKQSPKTWNWYKANGTEREHINATADPTVYNILLSNNVTKLTLLNLTKEDSGTYICSAVFDIKPIDSQLELKVLSFTEPLKPFIAIAIQVVIFVTLILLYERQSNKRKGPAGTTENGLYEHTP
ncbi:embigin precursor [Silurus asotus]|uniref:Embigin n=1 Tax=Silurus asotus TaxID=30991 RepID=A0AAD5AB63_SILAS|nr:embigin precursor [Silurus asotus]